MQKPILFIMAHVFLKSAAVLVFLLSATAQAATRVGCGHATRVPRIDVQTFEDHHLVTITGVGMTDFVRQLGVEVPNYWQGTVRAEFPLGFCRLGSPERPVAHCHRSPVSSTVFEVYATDGTHLGTKSANVVDINLVKTIVIHADGEHHSQSLSLTIDWFYPSPARLTADFAISTCSAQ